MARAFLSVLLCLLALTATLRAAPLQGAPWPVTVRDSFGTVTIPAAPKRILVVGLHEQDFLYALGIAPIGVHEWFGGQPYATWPWAEAARRAVGARPEVQRGFDIDLEWVWHLHPDLIIATYSAMDADDYAKLSHIAPVIAAPAGYPAWGAPWQAEMRLIAKATGRAARGEQVIESVAAKLQTLRARYPVLAGKSASAVYVANTRLTGYAPQDATSRFLTTLGLVVPQEFATLAEGSGQFTVSLERIGLFDQDVSLWLSDPQGRQLITAQKLYQSTRIAREGRAVWASPEEMAALSFQTPLSIAWVAGHIAPRLAQAVTSARDGSAKLSGHGKD